ncbi:MAG: ATP-binding cassette domain-containing protein [Candidatus Kapaibacterium sp.]
MLRVNKIEKSYGKKFRLDIENLTLEHPNVITLLGPNGSGKTTFLKILLGLVNPKTGDVEYKGKNINDDFTFKYDLSYMPQTAIYPENLKVKEIIEITKALKNHTEDYDYELYEQYRIDGILESKFSSLSQGTKQKIAASIVFMFRSPVIILDEPTAGLDPYAAELLKSKILKEKKDKLILFTTHIISDVTELSDRLIFLHEGKIKYDKIMNDEFVNRDSRLIISEVANYFRG